MDSKRLPGVVKSSSGASTVATFLRCLVVRAIVIFYSNAYSTEVTAKISSGGLIRPNGEGFWQISRSSAWARRLPSTIVAVNQYHDK